MNPLQLSIHLMWAALFAGIGFTTHQPGPATIAGVVLGSVVNVLLACLVASRGQRDKGSCDD